MGPDGRQSPSHLALIAMAVGPLLAAIAVFASSFVIRLPMLVYMLFPAALVVYLVVVYLVIVSGLMNQQAAKPQEATLNRSPSLMESNAVAEAPRSALILEWALLILLSVAFVLVWIIPHLVMFLALSVLLGIMTGYCIAVVVRVDNGLQRRVAAGGYIAPWWSASHAPVRRLRNVLFSILGTLILVALIFMPIPGIALVLGMAVGSLVTGPSVRYRLLQLESG